MTRDIFIDKNFAEDTLRIIGAANVVCREYAAAGFDMTLRQVFYQFVARGWLSNTEKSYKRLGSIVSDARLAGLLDWDYIVDRTRELEARPSWGSPHEIIEIVGKQYHRDLWEGQDYRIEVWIEKEALAGVIAPICRRLDVPFFSCRGYVSQSAMYEAATRLSAITDTGAQPIILHLGDHDPSGIDMSRDITDRLYLMGAGAEVERIALTMRQIEELNPPPNPTKLSDARAAGYIARFGRESWELDAIPPTQLTALIEQHVTGYRDDDLFAAAVEREREEADQISSVASAWSDVIDLIEGIGS